MAAFDQDGRPLLPKIPRSKQSGGDSSKPGELGWTSSPNKEGPLRRLLRAWKNRGKARYPYKVGEDVSEDTRPLGPGAVRRNSPKAPRT